MVREVIEGNNRPPRNHENITGTSGIFIDEDFDTETNSNYFKSFLDVVYTIKPSGTYEEKKKILFYVMVQLEINKKGE